MTGVIDGATVRNSVYTWPGMVDTERGLLLADGEFVQVGYEFDEDIVLATDRRLIQVRQEVDGGREYRSVALREVSRCSVTVPPDDDRPALLSIWVGSASAPAIECLCASTADALHLQAKLSVSFLP